MSVSVEVCLSPDPISQKHWLSFESWSCFRDDNSRTLELAEMVQSRLNAYKVEDMSLGKQPGQQKSQLIILDRSEQSHI